MTNAVANDVEQAELERCRATSAEDWAALSEVLSDELEYTHMNGMVEDKQQYLNGLRELPRAVRRGDLTVRIFGEIALVSGRQFFDFGQGDGEIESQSLGVWRLTDDAWRLIAFGSSRLA